MENIVYTMIEKAKVFVFDAGKVIMIISLVLWAFSSFGPTEKRNNIEEKYAVLIKNDPENTNKYEAEKSSALLENSYAGIMGRSIEPIIRPLGYDWKIGIALITSFAAREVFVGTMATLYSVGDDADENSETLRNKMHAAKRSDGTLVYTTATGYSLLIFYLFSHAMHEYFSGCKKRNRFLEMAYYTIDLHDWIGLFIEFYCISTLELIKLLLVF